MLFFNCGLQGVSATLYALSLRSRDFVDENLWPNVLSKEVEYLGTLVERRAFGFHCHRY